MPTQENGRPLDPTSRRTFVGERVHIDEVLGNNGGVSLADLTDVDDNVTPAKGSILVGDGSVYVEQPVGPDGYVLTADSSQVDGVIWAPGGGGGGLTPATHQTLRQLIHFIDEGPGSGFATGAFKETLPTGSPFPTSVIWWTDATKTKKIVEKLIVRSGGGATNVKPTPITWRVYDAPTGLTVVGEVVDTIVYSGAFESNRTRAVNV